MVISYPELVIPKLLRTHLTLRLTFRTLSLSMLPDRVSNPGPLTYDSGAKLLLWPVTFRNHVKIFLSQNIFHNV